MPQDALEPAIVVYDGDCFFCSNYVRLLNLRATMGNVTLINGREREKIQQLRLEPTQLTEGMVFIVGKKRYWGADALHRMALLSTSNAHFNRFNRFVFKHTRLAHFLYPLLRLGRRMSLFFAGKQPIR